MLSTIFTDLAQSRGNIHKVGQKLLHTGLKHFGETRTFFRRKSRLTPKINITFFVTNLMLNIFMLNNFFGKSVFSEETAINCSEGAQFGEPMCNKFWLTLYNRRLDQ